MPFFNRSVSLLAPGTLHERKQREKMCRCCLPDFDHQNVKKLILDLEAIADTECTQLAARLNDAVVECDANLKTHPAQSAVALRKGLDAFVRSVRVLSAPVVEVRWLQLCMVTGHRSVGDYDSFPGVILLRQDTAFMDLLSPLATSDKNQSFRTRPTTAAASADVVVLQSRVSELEAQLQVERDIVASLRASATNESLDGGAVSDESNDEAEPTPDAAPKETLAKVAGGTGPGAGGLGGGAKASKKPVASATSATPSPVSSAAAAYVRVSWELYPCVHDWSPANVGYFVGSLPARHASPKQ